MTIPTTITQNHVSALASFQFLTIFILWNWLIWRLNFTDYIYETIQSHHMFDFTQILNSAIADGLRFRGVYIKGNYTDLGTLKKYWNWKNSTELRNEIIV